MKKAICILSIVVAVMFASRTSYGEDLAPRRLAATDQLPPALLALDPGSAQIMTAAEAEDVRGQWIVNFNFPLFATQIEGWGRFDISMITLSGGTHAGKPIFVRLTIGR
jgi:hypothetical protein